MSRVPFWEVKYVYIYIYIYRCTLICVVLLGGGLEVTQMILHKGNHFTV